MGKTHSRFKKELSNELRFSLEDPNESYSCPICHQIFQGANSLSEVTSHANICVPPPQPMYPIQVPPPPRIRIPQPAPLLYNQIMGPPQAKYFPIPPQLNLHNSTSDTRIQRVRDNFNSIRVNWSDSYVKLSISRDNFFMDSMIQLLSFDTPALRSEFQINFIGEIAQDAGGLTKEWLNLLTKELLSSQFNLFKLTNTSDPGYTIVPNSFDPELYQLVGRVIGKALFENIPINFPLNKMLYKYILDHPVTSEDIQYIDKDLYNAMTFMLKNPIEGVFFEAFAIVDANGAVTDLIPNGRDTIVNDENKEIYVNLRVEYEIDTSIMHSVKWIKDGIFAVFNSTMIAELSPEELEFILCGNPIINVTEWHSSTIYRGEFNNNHQVIRWFWEVLEELSQKDLRDLLTYVTGTSRVPIEGFHALKTSRGEPAQFTIEPLRYFKNALPRAHTCFNRMDLPIYPSKHILKQAINLVITNHILGFGLE